MANMFTPFETLAVKKVMDKIEDHTANSNNKNEDGSYTIHIEENKQIWMNDEEDRSL